MATGPAASRGVSRRDYAAALLCRDRAAGNRAVAARLLARRYLHLTGGDAALHVNDRIMRVLARDLVIRQFAAGETHIEPAVPRRLIEGDDDQPTPADIGQKFQLLVLCLVGFLARAGRIADGVAEGVPVGNVCPLRAARILVVDRELQR